MNDTLKRLRQSRCLPYLAAALSFLVAWTGETGSLVWGGLCILLSLPLLAAPEYLLVPLLSAVLLDNNCNLLPGLTASRYFTMLFLAVEGLSVLLREKPRAVGAAVCLSCSSDPLCPCLGGLCRTLLFS